MIEFDGYIHGKAEKYFWRRNAVFGQKIFIVSTLLCFPLILLLSNVFGKPMVIVYLLFIILIPLMSLCARLPKSEKKRNKFLPFNVCVCDDYIVVQTKLGTESRNIEDVKKIYDYGEWYAFIFSMGKVSTNFICQKSLLSKGSLEEFESLFEGKIEDKTKKCKE